MKIKFKNSTLLFLHRLLQGIASSAIELFIPLIIYTRTSDLKLAFLFTAVQALICLLGFLFGRKIIRKNPIIFIILSLIPSIISYFMLNLEISIFLIIALGCLGGISSCFYYGSINLIFAVMDEKTDSAKFDAGCNLGKIFFTLLSAYLLGSVKNSLIFVVIFASVLSLLSALPLLINYKQLKSILGTIPKNNQMAVIKDTKWFNAYHCSMGVFAFFTDIFLPLYLAINGLSFSAVGIFMATGQVLKIIGCYIAKFMQSKKWNVFWIVSCSLLFLSSIIVFMLSRNNVLIYIMNLIITFSYASIHTILFNWYCKNQKRNNFVYDSMYNRDVCQNAGRIVATGIICLVFTSAFWIGIGAGVLNGVFGSLAVKKCEKDETKNIETNPPEENL